MGARAVSWNLKGSYVEICPCELMCRAIFRLVHGATYDFGRVTLVFNIREWQIEGIDIAGHKVAAIADTPKVMTAGNWRFGSFSMSRQARSSWTSLCRCSVASSVARWRH
jgi:hypothetical protein